MRVAVGVKNGQLNSRSLWLGPWDVGLRSE